MDLEVQPARGDGAAQMLQGRAGEAVLGRELLVELEDGTLDVRPPVRPASRTPAPASPRPSPNPATRAPPVPFRSCRGYRPPPRRRAPGCRTSARRRLSSPPRATVASSRCPSSSFVMSALLLCRLRVRRLRTYRTEVGNAHGMSAANCPLPLAPHPASPETEARRSIERLAQTRSPMLLHHTGTRPERSGFDRNALPATRTRRAVPCCPRLTGAANFRSIHRNRSGAQAAAWSQIQHNLRPQAAACGRTCRPGFPGNRRAKRGQAFARPTDHERGWRPGACTP